MSFLTSFCDFPQKEQHKLPFESSRRRSTFSPLPDSQSRALHESSQATALPAHFAAILVTAIRPGSRRDLLQVRAEKKTTRERFPTGCCGAAPHEEGPHAVAGPTV